MVRFYSQLFTSQENNGEAWKEEIIISKIAQDADQDLILPPEEEIQEIVKSMNKDSVEGPDGITIKFFQQFWEIIEKDVTHAV